MPSDGEPSLAEAIKETCLLTSSYLGYFASFDYRLLRLLRSIKEMDGFLAWSGGGNTLDCYVTWVSRCVEYSVDSASECQEYMRTEQRTTRATMLSSVESFIIEVLSSNHATSIFSIRQKPRVWQIVGSSSVLSYGTYLVAC
jgi:hypothetical protein